MALEPGFTVDRYVVLHELGRGGMATVYAVKHQVLGTKHALKVLDRAGSRARERIVREGRLQARLDPTFVVPVTDLLEVDGAPALLMPLVTGCSLAQLLQEYRPSVAEVAALYAQIEAGVRCAHAAGVVHRDLKPSNVLLEVKRGVVRARVSDFGVARFDDDPSNTRSGAFLGTPSYAAPEQLQDASEVDYRADLWSLGVILYELLVGRRPFVSEGVAGLFDAIRGGEFPRDEIPAEWIPLLESLLTDLESRAYAPIPTEVCEQPVGEPLAEAIRITSSSLTQSLSTGSEDTVEPGQPLASAPSAESRQLRFCLPAERDRFVGREQDLEAIDALMNRGERLISLVGLGGTGKTRLATHYGWAALSSWPGGVWFCDLSDARSADGITYAVGSALDVPLRRNPVEQIGHAIASLGRALIILDNFEQVASLAAKTLGKWRDDCPAAHFLVTTREVLEVAGEAVLPLAPLGPEDAAQLFESRARSANSRFSPSKADHQAIDELMRLLDHLPLAVELAAARVRVLSPAKILDRMSDRFRVLRSAGDRPERHSTLRAALDWSWHLLTAWERSALAQLSVFEGGFSMEAAEAILALDQHPDAPWALDVVQALVDKSLVRSSGDDRFDLLVTVREYACERLVEQGQREHAEQRHGAHYAELGTDEAIDSLRMHGGVQRRLALVPELSNLVVACRRACERGDQHTAVRALRAAFFVINARGPYTLGTELGQRVLDAVEHGSALRGIAEMVTGVMRWRSGRIDDAVRGYEAALTIARSHGDRRREADRLFQLGILEWQRGQTSRARQHYTRSLELAQQSGDRRVEGAVLGALGTLDSEQGQLEAALRHYETALRIARELGDRRSEGQWLGHLGILNTVRKSLDEARTQLDAAVAISRELGDTRSVGIWRGNRAQLLRAQKRFGRAAAEALEALKVARRVGDRAFQGIWNAELGAALRLDAQLERAAEHLGRGDELLREAGARYELAKLLCQQSLLASTRGDEAAALSALKEAKSLAEALGAGEKSELGALLLSASAAIADH